MIPTAGGYALAIAGDIIVAITSNPVNRRIIVRSPSGLEYEYLIRSIFKLLLSLCIL